MFRNRRVTALVERHAFQRGWHILSLYQPPWLFPDDGRRLKRCAIPTDPWLVTLGNHPSYLQATETRRGQGATADAAVMAAMPEPGIADDLLAACRRCEMAVDNLRDCLQKSLREERTES